MQRIIVAMRGRYKDGGGGDGPEVRTSVQRIVQHPHLSAEG